MGFIKEIGIENFKSLEKTTLRIKPLTLFFGPNSSGKSSAIKALLFLKKNIYPLNSCKLKYKVDNFTDLVSYTDIVSLNDKSKDIIYEIRMEGMYLFDKDPFNKGSLDNLWDSIEFSTYLSQREQEKTEKFNYYEFNIKLRFRFGCDDNYRGKLSNIEIQDIKEETTLIFHNKSKEDAIIWDYDRLSNNYNNPAYDIFDYVLKGNVLPQNIKPPFLESVITDYQQILRFENYEIYGAQPISAEFSLQDKINAARLYYFNFIVVPNILNSSLSGFHLSTTRLIPQKKYYLTDDGAFKNEDYYGYLNELYIHQNSLTKFFFENWGSDKKDNIDIKYYFNLIISLDKLEKETLDCINSVTKSDGIINYYDGVDTYEKVIYALFWIFEELECTNKVKNYEDLLYYFSGLDEKEKRRLYELKIFSSLKPETSLLIYKLYKSNQNIKSKRINWHFEDNRIPNFQYNFSVLLNKSLKALGFDSILFIQKTLETGSVFTMKSNGTMVNLINESSGLQQLLPILLGFVIIKSHLYTSITSRRIVEVGHDVFLNAFEFQDPSIEYQLMHDLKSSIFIEQPELHLHPKLQTDLADYIGKLTKSFKPYNYIVLETHSEHIIRTIQLQIAKGELSNSNVSVNYFEKTGGYTKVKNLRIAENGNFLDPWPNGFFDEAAELSLELLKAQLNRSN